MKLVRAIIGTTIEDRDNFVNDFLRLFPDLNTEALSDRWRQYSMVGVMQILINLENGEVVSVQETVMVDQYTNYMEWKFTMNFVRFIPQFKDEKLLHTLLHMNKEYSKIPNINSIKPEELLDIGLQQTVEYNKLDDNDISGNEKPLSLTEKVDIIFDKISEKGYESLSSEEKSILEEYKKSGECK
jgi:hypothetical protein